MLTSVIICQTLVPCYYTCTVAAANTVNIDSTVSSDSMKNTSGMRGTDSDTSTGTSTGIDTDTNTNTDTDTSTGTGTGTIIAGTTDSFGTSNTSNINIDRAKILMMGNNRILKERKRSLTEYMRGYESALKAAEEMEDEDFLEAPNNYYRMLLYKKMYLIPAQREHESISARDNIKTYENQLIINLRSHYQPLLTANSAIEIQKKKYSVDKKLHNLNVVKYRNGMITELELEESEYSLLKAQMDINEVVRNYENICRNFNLYIGSPIGTYYNEVEYEKLDDTPMYDIDFYYEEALKNRHEIQSIERQISLKKLEMEILEKNQAYKIYTRVKKEHENIAVSIKNLELDLEKTRLNIKKEVYSIFVDAVKASEAIGRAERNLDNVKRKLYLAEARYNAGVLSELTVEQAKLSVQEAEVSIKNAVYNYNTQLIKLYNAAGLYSGGISIH